MSNNLDVMINEIGFKIVEKINKKDKNKTKYKNEIDKALGVLANDGVYAYYVYVKSKKVDNIFFDEIKPIVDLIHKSSFKDNDWQNFFTNLSGNLNNLLFFREILERILIYARYHAKAMGD